VIGWATTAPPDSSVAGWTGWQDWFGAFGDKGPVTNSHRVNNDIIALQAACNNMGAVLGWVGLTRPYPESGSLVALLPDRVEPREDFDVRLQVRASHQARLLHDWLVQAA
jgi:DNA-binding transcriptional LysR family regulator